MTHPLFLDHGISVVKHAALRGAHDADQGVERHQHDHKLEHIEHNPRDPGQAFAFCRHKLIRRPSSQERHVHRGLQRLIKRLEFSASLATGAGMDHVEAACVRHDQHDHDEHKPKHVAQDLNKHGYEDCPVVPSAREVERVEPDREHADGGGRADDDDICFEEVDDERGGDEDEAD
eukprot:1541808-Rhodomonas_salina.2